MIDSIEIPLFMRILEHAMHKGATGILCVRSRQWLSEFNPELLGHYPMGVAQAITDDQRVVEVCVMTAMELQTCSMCKVEKPREFFRRDRTRWSGRKSSCKGCMGASDESEKMSDNHVPAAPSGKKACKVCFRTMDHVHFHKDKTRPDGLAYRCKDCVRDYFRRNASHVNEMAKKWRLKNPDKCREMGRRHREKVKALKCD